MSAHITKFFGSILFWVVFISASAISTNAGDKKKLIETATSRKSESIMLTYRNYAVHGPVNKQCQTPYPSTLVPGVNSKGVKGVKYPSTNQIIIPRYQGYLPHRVTNRLFFPNTLPTRELLSLP